MKTRWATLLFMAVLAAAAAAQPPYLYRDNNEIGIYLTPTPTAEDALVMSCYQGAPGTFTAYVVVTNPYNDTQDRPIDLLAGFELRLEPPAGVIIVAATPPELTLFTSPPDYLCGGVHPIPVQGAAGRRHVVLMSLTVVAPAPDPAVLFIAPLSDFYQPSVPGYAAISDAEDNNRLALLHPVSGSYDAPVFGLYECGQVVPGEQASWGGLQSLFR